MQEYVQNASDNPIPKPYEMRPEDKRDLFDFQRRKHLLDWDDKKKRMPLSKDEREQLDFWEQRIADATVPMYAGNELKFGPWQIYEVPQGHGAAICKLHRNLKMIPFEEVVRLSIKPSKVNVQTKEDALKLLEAVSVDCGDDGQLHSGTVTIEMKDGQMRFGDGKWSNAPSNPVKLESSAAIKGS